MPARASAFGPTAGTPSIRRPSMLSRLASGGGGGEDIQTGTIAPTARLPRAQEQFQPIFPNAPEPSRPEGPGPQDAGAFAGGEAPPMQLQSMPLLSPSQEARTSLLSRLAADRGQQLKDAQPSDTETALAAAKTGVKAAGGLIKIAERGEPLLERILSDAGFSQDTIQNLVSQMDKLNLPSPVTAGGTDLAEAGIGAADQATGSTLEQLAGNTGETVAAAGELSSGLGAVAQYLPFIGAALGIGTVAAGDMQDDQKVVQSIGIIAQLGAQLAVSSAAGAAAASAAAAAGLTGAAAGVAASAMVAGIAAPVAMAIADVVQHFMDQMEDVPHRVREQQDVGRRTQDVQFYAQDLDEAPDLTSFLAQLAAHSVKAVGGHGGEGPSNPTAFAAILREPAISPATGKPVAFKFIGKPNHTYPTATLDEILAHPELVEISPQAGVAPGYTEGWRASLTNMVRNRLALFARARGHDPAAMASLELLAGRVKKAKQGRADEASRIQSNEAEQSRLDRLAAGGGSGGDSGASG